MEFSVNLHQSFVRVVEDKDIVYLEKGDNVLGKIFSDSYADLQRMIGREVIGDLSIILAPLIEADRIEGMIMFESAELIESDISTINIFVQQLTYALKRAQHFEQAQREIAVRMEVEKALRASEDKFSKSFYLSPNAVSISFAETGELIDVNQGFLDIFGYERSEVIGKTITEIALWKNKDDREKMVRMLQKDGSVRNFESQGITKSGKVFLGNISAELIEIDGEEYVLVVFDDITERKKAENALRESEEKFRLYMENAHDGIMVFGSDYRFEYVNKEFCKICGYPYEEVIVKRITDFLDEGAKKKILNQYDNRRKEKSSVSRFVFPIIRKNGEKRMVEISSAVIEDSKGDLKTIAHLLDVTERFQLQEQLNQSQKMEAIGQLAGGVAHDFNNLLTVISGYSNLLLMESRLNKDTKEKIEQIQRAAGRAEVLTRQLLAFSRKQIIQPKVVCINMIIRDSLKMIDRIIGEDIRVDLKLSDDLPSILADPHQVEQILINLVVNARDAVYVHPDSFARKLITIETKSVYLDDQFLKTHTDVNAGSYIEFSVSDTGIGMDREMTKKIFEPFFTTKDKSKGTGLGLSTVYGIVKQNKGTVNVYSELGRGTTLKVYWPAVENVSETQEEEKNTALQKGSEVVLLVEDDEDVRNFSAEAIRSFGYRIYVANNAKEALDMIKNDGIVPDLLITDIIMPEMNGKELSEEIKKALPDIKILFTSGYPDNHILSKGFIEAGVHFLEKPFSLDALSAKIRDVINAGNV
jgi:PAS domain S-box-containing protein